MNIQNISFQVNELATKGCRPFSLEEKEKFFRECCTIKRNYIKGKNKGKERELYYVDGVCFNQIWKLVTPYIYTACSKSVYYDNYKLPDAMAEVRFLLFYSLQRFGPTFQQQSLSQRLPVIVNMALTNNHRKSRTVIHTYSLVNEISEESEERDYADSTNTAESIEFWSSIPSHLRPAVEEIISGNSLTKTCEKFKLNKKRLQVELASLLRQ